MSDGWSESAKAWVAHVDEGGGYARAYVLDAPMLQRVKGRNFRTALDVGCGEGRFSRMLGDLGIATTGVDPTEELVRRARERDRRGDYRLGRAEQLDFADAQFDLVVSYLSLIDIPDIGRAIPEMARVLRPGGTLLIANLTGFNTAGPDGGWVVDESGRQRFFIDHYMEERSRWVDWRGIRVQNWHRPLSTYMTLLLNQGLQLRYFDEPVPVGGDAERASQHRRVPLFMIMEWTLPN